MGNAKKDQMYLELFGLDQESFAGWSNNFIAFMIETNKT